MWIFGSWGLVMPAAVLPGEDITNDKYTENGKYDLQVRGRLESHLRNFMDLFMEPGTYNPEIQYTPNHDYNMRFYTTHEAFAAAAGRAVMAIDYRKFKPSAERRDKDGKLMYGADSRQYHMTLNGIWATVCDLNTPGDVWGPWSPENPKGYKSASRLSSTWGGDESWGIGSSFGSREWDDEFDDWTPNKEEEIDMILRSLEGIPVDQWFEMTNEHEWDLIKGVAWKEMEAKIEHEQEAARKSSRRNNNKRYARRNKSRKGSKARYQ